MPTEIFSKLDLDALTLSAAAKSPHINVADRSRFHKRAGQLANDFMAHAEILIDTPPRK